MDLKETYNKIGEDWFKRKPRTWWVEGVDKFISLLKKGDSVLDIGCGPGLKAKIMIERGLKVTGIDFSEKMIEIAKREVLAGEFIIMDAKDISGFNGLYDGIFALAVLLHFPKKDAENILKNWTNKLKSGGYFYLAVKELMPGQQEETIVKEENYGYSYERFFSYFSRQGIKDYFRELDLKIIWENKFSPSEPWIQIIARK